MSAPARLGLGLGSVNGSGVRGVYCYGLNLPVLINFAIIGTAPVPFSAANIRAVPPAINVKTNYNNLAHMKTIYSAHPRYLSGQGTTSTIDTGSRLGLH